MNYDYKEVVANIQSLLYECDPNFIENDGLGVSYYTNSYFDVIKFDEIDIFNSECDISDCYLEETDDYISQDDFEKHVIKNLKDRLQRVCNALDKAIKEVE